MTARRNPGLAGVGGVTASDLAALDAGLITMIDLASKLGVSKQAVSRKLRSMRSISSIDASATAAPPSSTSPTGSIVTPPSTGAVIPADAIVIDAMQLAVSANLGVLHCAHGLLAGGGPLGPSAVKALSGAIASARAELTALGVLAPDDADTALSVLTVRTMSDVEHDQAKAAAEELSEFDD
jgi:hypothetical protein